MADSNQLASWRRDLQQVHDSLMKGEREQFEAWFEESALIEAEMKEPNEEFRQAVEDIKKDRQRYRQLIKQLPNVAEFSAEELEKRSGKASQLLDIATEVVGLEIHLPRKVDRLAYMLKHRVQ